MSNFFLLNVPTCSRSQGNFCNFLNCWRVKNGRIKIDRKYSGFKKNNNEE